ncbi:MAG: hypothetical protein K2F79_03315 [Muribaculaceae bacterium]|nr:hypothetical protein [Muribaculaceae bacterium]
MVRPTLISVPRELAQGGKSFLYLSSAYGRRRLACAVCGREIAPGEPFVCDRYDTVVCSRHHFEFCKVCERIILGQPSSIRHLGSACALCASERSKADLEKAVNTIYGFFKEKRIFIPRYSVDLIKASAMNEKYAREFGFMPMGAAVEKYTGTEVIPPGETRYHIDLMSQQSPTSLAKTLAHEVLHLWQYHRDIKAPVPYAEGFCNLGAYQVLASTFSTTEAMVLLKNLMEDPDPSYGVAFRELKVMHDVHGWISVIAAMRSFSASGRSS